MVLLVRAEAAGVVTGKRCFVLNCIRERSGAKIQLLREEVKSQRPCVLTGSLQTVLRAERHIIDLVRAVPVTPPVEVASHDSGGAASSKQSAWV